MTFNKPVFVLILLPAILLLYRAMPQKGRRALLIIYSLLFVFLNGRVDLLYLICGIIFNYLTALQVAMFRSMGQQRKSKIIFITGVAADLAFLCFFKYAPTSLTPPIGVSFFTFSLISFLADVYMNKARMPGIADFSLFVLFFPKLSMGPIVKFSDFMTALRTSHPSDEQAEAGAVMFLSGLAKKVLLANNLQLLFTAAQGATDRGTLLAWLGALAYAFMLYFDFAGYSEMAIGISHMFGLSFAPNFRHPYVSASVSEFWRRWHISLGAFFRDYVYIPLGGNRGGGGRTAVNLLTVWLLTGVWHGNTLAFVLWGLYHFAFIALEKFVLKDVLKKIPRPVRVVFTFFVVALGWVFFFSPTLADAIGYFTSMFTAGAGGSGGYYLTGFIALLLISAVAALPAGENIGKLISGRFPTAWRFVRLILWALLFVLSVAGMVSDTFSSFLYAAF